MQIESILNTFQNEKKNIEKSLISIEKIYQDQLSCLKYEKSAKLQSVEEVFSLFIFIVILL